MNKAIKFFVLLGFVFLLVIILGNYFWQQQLKTAKGIDLSEIVPEIKGLSPEQILNPQSQKIKEFISPDEKLRIKYSSKWIETNNEDLKRTLAPEQTQKYNLINLFLAQRFEITGEFAQLTIEQGFLDAQQSFEEILAEMKEVNLQQEWNMEIIESEIQNDEITFEARYQKVNAYSVYSQEKIIFLEPETDSKKAYFISCIVLEKDWPKFKQEVNEIFDSVEINR